MRYLSCYSLLIMPKPLYLDRDILKQNLYYEYIWKVIIHHRFTICHGYHLL